MRNVGREVAGAWRSLRYDLARRPAPDDPTDLIYPEYEPAHRPRRRLLAATTFGVLALTGAGGTYFAVVSGLSALASEETVPPARLPAMTPAPAPEASTPAPVTSPPRVKPKPTPSHRAVLGRATVRPPAPTPTCACVTPPVPRPTSAPPVTQPPDPEPSTAPPSPDPTPEPTEAPSDPPGAAKT
ncbi:hypothetical protein [Phytohabitans rumicis]|uniref:hypothetical protein n=1 Tax=Phytohabitans rumicis TaxID=1076125 RepID=UPI00156790F8|nr:hypothetical protein [Phytohabitans rumicis]